MNSVFTRVQITPSYAAGFSFFWDLSQGFSDTLPWIFTIEEAPTVDGPWTTITPELVNKFSFTEQNKKRVISKDLILFFRIKLNTPKNTYYSDIITPYGDLNRREYLLVRDIMRREVLQQKTLSGVKALVYIKSVLTVKCPYCVDPITGDSLTTNCKQCLGTGKMPPYHGPYEIWATFSTSARNTEVNEGGLGITQVYPWEVRCIGFPYLKDYDILIDPTQDKRYIIDGVQHLVEMRRVCIVQQVKVTELSVTDPVYKLGTDLYGKEGCELK